MSSTSTTNFINPTPTKAYDKSISLVESKSRSRSVLLTADMSYRTNDLPAISRHLSESPPPLSNSRQNYEDLVSCSICYEVYDNVNQLKAPKILPCQHTYCVECIKNLVNVSTERQAFCCPQCKFKVTNLSDPTTLPTSRIVLSLLEKESFNYQGFASCPSCRQVRNLEVCFECNLPLCNQCIGKHFESWKKDINEDCAMNEKSLEAVKLNVDKINPMITQNFEYADRIKTEIDATFDALFQRLNEERASLLKVLDEVRDGSAKYVNFKKDLVSLITSFKVLREENETYDKKSMNTRLRKLHQYREQVKGIEKSYSDLNSNTFKIIEKFEKRPLPDSDYQFSGNLIIAQMNVESKDQEASVVIHRSQSRIQQPIKSPSSKPLAPVANRESSIPSAPSMMSISKESVGQKSFSISEESVDRIEKWIEASNSTNPHFEMTVQTHPLHICSFQGLLFCIDVSGVLTVYEKAFTHELKLKNTTKLNAENIRGMAANQNFLAISYTGLKKDQLKGPLKTTGPNGVVLYRRDQHVVCTVFEKHFDVAGSGFKSPSSICLSEKYLYVLDRDLVSVVQFDIKTRSLVNKISNLNKNVDCVSLNPAYLLISSPTTYSLHDSDTLATISSASTPSTQNSSTHITDQDLIFAKKEPNQVTLLDMNFAPRANFNAPSQSKMTSVCLIRDQQSDMLIVGNSIGSNKQQQFKLFGFVISN